MRVKLVVAYDGTDYCGWQVQPNGITVEEVLNRELSRLLKEEITVTGASRTDSGVHSLGNVAVFDTDTRMPAEKISYAINQRIFIPALQPAKRPTSIRFSIGNSRCRRCGGTLSFTAIPWMRGGCVRARSFSWAPMTLPVSPR